MRTNRQASAPRRPLRSCPPAQACCSREQDSNRLLDSWESNFPYERPPSIPVRPQSPPQARDRRSGRPQGAESNEYCGEYWQAAGEGEIEEAGRPRRRAHRRLAQLDFDRPDSGVAAIQSRLGVDGLPGQDSWSSHRIAAEAKFQELQECRAVQSAGSSRSNEQLATIAHGGVSAASRADRLESKICQAKLAHEGSEEDEEHHKLREEHTG